MKQLLVFCLAAVMVFASNITATGEEKIKVKGTIIKIEESTKSVTIQPKEGEPVTIIMEDGDLLWKVKEGQKGQAIYIAKDGTNLGMKLKKLTQGCD